jgi:hypothetical protein
MICSQALHVPRATHLVPALDDGNRMDMHDEHSVENIVLASVDIIEIGREADMLEM